MWLRCAGGRGLGLLLRLEAPASVAAFHAEVLLFVRLRGHVEQADASVKRALYLPILSIERTGGAMTAPVDVIVDDFPPSFWISGRSAKRAITDCTTAFEA